MNAKDVIRKSINSTDMIVDGYLEDLTDAELLVRPVPGANHIAWQLGHLINSEHDLVEGIAPGSMPKLPGGFKEKYAKETAASDDPKAFHTKTEYRRLLKEQRAGTFAALEKTPEGELDKPAPEEFRSYCPTVADVFLLQGTHVMMHAGQWAVTRRKLGRKPLF
ncbi:MAG: DinB family protein [Planctomycetia bacterium]|nr:DinB family protein [Planctomycetia bacterium]